MAYYSNEESDPCWSIAVKKYEGHYSLIHSLVKFEFANLAYSFALILSINDL